MAETEDGKGVSLEKIIAEARKVLTEHNGYLRGNETATRALVIDRVVDRIGLGHQRPSAGPVGASRQREQGGLRSPVVVRQRNRAVVESKPADSGPKETDRRQASGYATEIGARYAVLTNGGRWEAWEMVQQKARKESIFVEGASDDGGNRGDSLDLGEAAPGCTRTIGEIGHRDGKTYASPIP